MLTHPPGFSTLPTMTNSLSALSLDQLKQAIALKEQIAALESQLTDIFGGTAETPAISTSPPRGRGRPPGKGGMSVEGRARIASAQKARWAKFRAAEGRESSPAFPSSRRPHGKGRVFTPEHRAKLAAAQKARFAKLRKVR